MDFTTTELLLETRKTLIKLNRRQFSFVLSERSHQVTVKMSDSESDKNANGNIESDMKYLMDAMQHLNLDCNPGSRLMASIAKMLSDSVSATPMNFSVKSRTWPCSPNYDGEVLKFNYLEDVFEVSVLHERKHETESLALSYYIVVNFVKNPFLYLVVEYLPSLVPEFKSRAEMIIYQSSLEEIDKFIIKPISKLCYSIKTGTATPEKLREKEFNCIVGIDPQFYHEQRNKSKQGKKFRPDNKSVVLPNYYRNLRKLFHKLQETPNSCSCLFALVLRILKSLKQQGEENPSTVDDWPVPAEYKNDLIEVDFSKPDHPKPADYIFEMVLLYTSNAYFLIIKHKESRIKTVHKLSKKLTPSFVRDQAFIEKEKIENLITLLREINENFIAKVVKSNFKPITLWSPESSGPPSVN